MGLAERVGELASAGLGHDQIGQEQIDSASAVFGKEPSRVISAGSFDHFVTEPAQHPHRNVANANVVFEN